MMQNFRERLQEFGSPTHLAIIRIIFAVHVFTVLLSPANDLMLSFQAKIYPLTGSAVPPFIENFLWQFVPFFKYLGLVATALLAIGLLTRANAILTFVCFFVTQNYYFRHSCFHDDWLYFTFYLIILCLSPCADTLSIDTWLKRRRDKAVRPAAFGYQWPLELMIVWFGVIYTAAGIAKIFPIKKGLLWLSGTSLQQFIIEFHFDSPIYGLIHRALFNYNTPTALHLFSAASIATAILELAAILVIFHRRWHWIIVPALLGMHASILMFGIPGFLQICTVSTLLFIPNRWFKNWDERLAFFQRSA